MVCPMIFRIVAWELSLKRPFRLLEEPESTGVNHSPYAEALGLHWRQSSELIVYATRRGFFVRVPASQELRWAYCTSCICSGVSGYKGRRSTAYIDISLLCILFVPVRSQPFVNSEHLALHDKSLLYMQFISLSPFQILVASVVDHDSTRICP